MKKIIYFLLFILQIKTANAQNSDNLNLLVAINSPNYQFIGLVYKTSSGIDMNSMRDLLETKTGQYEYGMRLVVSEIKKAQALTLINKYNNVTLKNFQDKLSVASNNFASWDFSLPQNVNKALEFVTWIYTVESIREEINLLHLVNDEIVRLKDRDPDNFFRSNRYAEMKLVLSKMKDCNYSQFKDIKMEYGLY